MKLLCRKSMAWAMAAMFTTAAFGCSPSYEPGSVDAWLSELKNPEKRTEALRELGKLGDKKAVPAVKELFLEAGEWQPEAAYTLGMLGDASVTQDLIASIDLMVGTGRDKASKLKQKINQNAARALGMLKAKDAVDTLTRLIGNQEPYTKEAAMRALGKIGDEKAVDTLSKVAMENPHSYLRKIAIIALGDLGSPKAVPTLVKALYIEWKGVSFINEAGYSLVQIGEHAAQTLMQTLLRKNEDVESIRMKDGSPIQEGAIEAKAARILGDLRHQPAEDPILAALKKYYGIYKGQGPVHATIPGAVTEFTEALGNLGSEKSVEMLQTVAMDEFDRIRAKATEALTKIGARNALPALMKAAQVGDKTVRRHAVVAISRLGSADDLGSYDALANAGGIDPAAMKSLVEKNRARLLAAKECQAKAECWQAKLADKNALVRERAAWELGWKGEGTAVKDLLKAAEDEDVDVRVAAVNALSKTGGIKADDLQPIWDKWHEKIDYRVANDELRRLMARVEQ